MSGKLGNSVEQKILSQNGLIERLNKTLRVECVDQNWFTSLNELNEALQHWLVTYNTLRPHENLKYKTRDQFEILNQDLYFYPVAA